MLQSAVLAAAVVYIIWVLVGEWEQLREHVWRLRAGPALLSVPLAAAWFLLRARLWQRILSCFGHTLAYRRALRTFVLAELSRYLPGTVWHVLSRSYLSSRQGIPTPVALTAVILELALVALAATAFVPLRAIGGRHAYHSLTLWAAVAVPLLLVLAHPRVVIPLINAGLRRFSRPPLPALGYRDLFGMLALCALMWACLCAGFVLLASSITPAATRAPVGVAASFPAAWFVGLIAIAAPGGIGAREGALVALLGGLLPGGMAVVVALVSRVWLTVIELLFAAIAWRLPE